MGPGRRTTRSSNAEPQPQSMASSQSADASFGVMEPSGGIASSSTLPRSTPNVSVGSTSGFVVASTTVLPTKRRGKAKNTILINHKARTGQKPRIEIPPGRSKPVGSWSEQFASEVGIICRKYAPLALQNWIKVKKEFKSKVNTMHEHIMKSFDIDIHLPHVERAVNKYLGQRLKEYRCRLHKYYKSLPNDQRRRKPYEGMVAQGDWELLCDWFETEKFKQLSTKNKENRGQMKVNHRGGSRSFLNHRADKINAETQQEPGRIEFYRMMYFNPGKGWSGIVAQENYDKMLEMQAQSLQEGSTPMTDDEIVDKVLGTKSGYVMGLGYGVDPLPSSSYNHPDVEDLRRRAEAAKKQAEEYEKQAQELTTRLHENEGKVEELQNWKAASEAKLEFLMAHFGARFSTMARITLFAQNFGQIRYIGGDQ